MISLTLHVEYSECSDGRKVHVNPSEIAAVQDYRYHSFRNPIAQITLKCGDKIKVWDSVATVLNKIAEDNERAEVQVTMGGD